MKRHTKIFLGLAIGAVSGVLSNFLFRDSPQLQFIQKYFTDPAGKIFLNFLIMMVIPLVFASLSLGVAQIGDLKKLGRIGLKTISYFFVVTAFAVTIGLILVNVIKPGNFLPEETKTELIEKKDWKSIKKRRELSKRNTIFPKKMSCDFFDFF